MPCRRIGLVVHQGRVAAVEVARRVSERAAVRSIPGEVETALDAYVAPTTGLSPRHNRRRRHTASLPAAQSSPPGCAP